MLKLIAVGFCAFVLGFIVSFIIQKILNSKNSRDFELFRLLSEFQKTLEDYKNQNTINTKEVKDAIKDASNLARVLTTNQNLKGQFGEECLEAIISVCYPNKDINYIKQFVSKNDNGNQIKPDYLVKLPNQKSILIDCKLNLEKYIDFKNSPDPDKKAEFIKDINNTINNLSNKISHFQLYNTTFIQKNS